MAAINKVIIIGNLGKNPEVRKTQGGTSVASFSVATTEKFSDRSGNKQEKTEWHNIVMWDKMAELAGKYLKKGSSVYLEGKLQTTSWEDKSGGGKKYKTEIVANQMQFLGGKSSSQQSTPQDLPSRDINNDMPQQGGMDEELPSRDINSDVDDQSELPF